MTRLMLAASLAALIVLNTAAANAGPLRCSWVGRTFVCHDDGSGRMIRCSGVGNATVCNDG